MMFLLRYKSINGDMLKLPVILVLKGNPYSPLHSFQSFAENNGDILRRTTPPAANIVAASPASDQLPKKTLAVALVEGTKKQSVALAPKEIAKIAQRFFPLFNTASFPHKPPPAAVTNQKQEAVEILASLWEASKYSELQGYQGVRELQSQHNVSLFLQLITDSDPQIKPMVRRCAMKLIYCISNGHPAGVPFAPSPAKRNVITTLAAILTNSPDAEDRFAAAGIISQLPVDDITIDKILRKSEALKVIHEVSKLDPYPLQIRILSKGTSLAKQRTATALANLSLSTSNKPPSYSSITAGISSDFPFGDY
ncbi:hypothetical protein F0562_001707 [Nyssa sinensis]|uniref:Armadillo repeat-containing domain-containing protein n=1 Tax=Nyssa sinensis TaxID=561372 RepID=A0A5J5C3Q9_9ASTE|nr:hypothetical protein F0562_001707 [Nyssa sinensis]